MRRAIVAFVIGVACLQTQARLPDELATPLAAVAGVSVGLWYLTRRMSSVRRVWCSLPYGFAAGFCWAALLAHGALAPQLAKSAEGRDVTLVGTVASLPNRSSQGVRFNFAVERVLSPAMAVPPTVALSWYAGYRDRKVNIGDIQPGQRWRLMVRLQRPHGNANPYGFDYEVWLLEQGVRATGYVRGGLSPDGGNRQLDDFVFGFSHAVERCRAILRSRILDSLHGREYAGVIVALVVGDQRGIDQADWQVFNRTGIGHLISISGLHITMIAGLFALIASALWRRSFFTDWQLPLLLPAQKVAALTGAAVALLYVLLAGFGVPAQRTLYMLSVVAVALWLGRITSVSHVLCSALGLVVLLDPWAVLWPGFWLSFGAVATILYATVGRTRVRVADPAAVSRGRRLWSHLKLGAHTQYVVTLGLVPLTMLLFAQVSLVSPIANALAIPVISLVVTPLALLGSLLPAPLSDWLLRAAHDLVWLLAQALQWLGNGRFAVWSAPTPSWWAFCWALFGTLWMLAPRGWPQRWLGIVTWIPLLAAQPSRPPSGQLWVTAFDVGQGMALLIETSGHRLLYDTGPLYSPESDAGNRVIVPYLKARGIGRLDGMIVSHSDADHAGGALSVLAALPVGWLVSSLWPDHPVLKAAPPHWRCVAGQYWVWDGVRFEMLHPAPASYDDGGPKPNTRGCTLKISAGGGTMLLAADIEAAQEAQLVQQAPAALRADVLLAPHHGSGTSSTLPFLLAVRPQLALFQVGYRNRYQHPKAEVYDRYGALGIKRLRSDVSGAVTLRFGPVLTVTEYRLEHGRYWSGQ